MPVGIIINSLSIVIGGVVGAFVGKKLSQSFIENMTMIFGCCSMGMGIGSIVLMSHLPAVIFAVILGSAIGMALHVGEMVNKGGMLLQKGMTKIFKESGGVSKEEFEATMLTCIVLFCASGTGIYGCIVSGMSGDHSILIAKSILDLFTAMIFACTLGMATSVVALPQFLIFISLFLLSVPIYTGLDIANNPYIINDFKACGGCLMIATGFRMIKVKMFPIADMIPAMILIFPLSILWENVIDPLVKAIG